MKGKRSKDQENRSYCELSSRAVEYQAGNVSSNPRRKFDQKLTTADDCTLKQRSRCERVSLSPINNQSYNDASISQFPKQNEPVKKENARRRQFEAKANNIDIINGKIHDLLQLVKKDRIHQVAEETKEYEYNCHQKSLCEHDRKEYGRIKELEEGHRRQPVQAGVGNQEVFDYRRLPGTISSIKTGQIKEETTQRKYRYQQKDGEVTILNASMIQTPSSRREKKDYFARKSIQIILPEAKENFNLYKRDYENQSENVEPKMPIQISHPRKQNNILEDSLESNSYKQTMRPRQRSQLAYEPKTEQKAKDRDIARQQELKRMKSDIRGRNQSSYEGYQLKRSFIVVEQKMNSPIKGYNIDQPRSSRRQGLPRQNSPQRQEQSKSRRIDTTTRMIDQQLKKIRDKINQSDRQKETMKQKYTELNRQSSEFAGRRYKQADNSGEPRFLQGVKRNIAQLVQKLNTQVNLDNNLRNLKEIFEGIQSNDKWQQLRRELASGGMYLDDKDLQETMRLASDEHTPFRTEKNATCSLRDIAKCIVKAEQFWTKEVMGSIDMQKLKADGFSIEDMDLNKKGYLNIEDLVCFINLYSGNFYRNREVSTTYRRLGKLESNKSANGIQYQTFLSALTRQ